MLVGVTLIALVTTSVIGPDTAVYPGDQVPEKYLETLQSLQLLQEDEQVQFFYSDAMFDIKNGLYFVTDKHLVLYSSAWDDPERIIPFEEIAFLDIEYDDSYWNDTMASVTTTSFVEVSFPISSEDGLDKIFVKAIREHLSPDIVQQRTAGSLDP